MSLRPHSVRSGSACLLASAALVAATLASAPASAAETRGFVFNWFLPATSFHDDDCPKGVNPLSEVFYRRILKDMGYSPKEVDELLSGFPNDGAYKEVITLRGRNGENVYADPASVPDPGMLYAEGRYADGMNLDGKVETGGFEDPTTHEKGVDNQFYRIVGCIQSHRAPPPARPTYTQVVWDILRDQIPAYVVEVSGIDDFTNDDDVTVGVYRALERVERDGSGDVRADATFRIDTDPRSHNTLRGRIKDGVLTTDPVDHLKLVGDPYAIMDFDFRQARIRLAFRPDGSAKGILAGYHDWRPIYWHYGSSGWVVEHSTALEVPAIYYGLKKFADAYPDPKTGQNMAISITYELDVRPAFLIHPPAQEKVSAVPAGQPTRTAASANSGGN